MATRPVHRRLLFWRSRSLILVSAAAAAGSAAAEDHHQLPDAQRRIVADVHRQGRRLLPEVRPRRGSAVRRPPGRRRDADERPGGDGELTRSNRGWSRAPRTRRRSRCVGSSLEQGPVRADGAEGVHGSEAAQGQAHRGRPDRRRAVQLHRGAARRPTGWASATSSGFRSAPTSAAAPRRCRPTAPTPRC